MSVINDALRRLERAERGDAPPPADTSVATGRGVSAGKRPARLVVLLLVACVAGVAWWQWSGRPDQGQQTRAAVSLEMADAGSPSVDRSLAPAASAAPVTRPDASFVQVAQAPQGGDGEVLADDSVAGLTADPANEGVDAVTSLAGDDGALSARESAAPTEVGVLTETAPVERTPAEDVADQDVTMLTAEEKPNVAKQAMEPVGAQPVTAAGEAAAVAALTDEPDDHPVSDGETGGSVHKRPSSDAAPADASTEGDTGVATLTASPATPTPGGEPVAEVSADDEGVAVSSLTGGPVEQRPAKVTPVKNTAAAGQAPGAPAAPVSPVAARPRLRSNAPGALDDVQRLAQLGRYAQALQLARSLPRPRNRQQRLQRAGLLLPLAAQAGDCALAISSADELPEVSRSGDQWFWLGYCHLQDGRYPQAVQDFRAATGDPVQRARTWLYLGIALQQTDHHADAIDAFHQARTLDASLPEIAFNAGLSYLALGDGARARAALVHFLEATDAQAVRYAAQRARVKSLLARN